MIRSARPPRGSITPKAPQSDVASTTSPAPPITKPVFNSSSMRSPLYSSPNTHDQRRAISEEPNISLNLQPTLNELNNEYFTLVGGQSTSHWRFSNPLPGRLPTFLPSSGVKTTRLASLLVLQNLENLRIQHPRVPLHSYPCSSSEPNVSALMYVPESFYITLRAFLSKSHRGLLIRTSSTIVIYFMMVSYINIGV